MGCQVHYIHLPDAETERDVELALADLKDEARAKSGGDPYSGDWDTKDSVTITNGIYDTLDHFRDETVMALEKSGPCMAARVYRLDDETLREIEERYAGIAFETSDRDKLDQLDYEKDDEIRDKSRYHGKLQWAIGAVCPD